MARGMRWWSQVPVVRKRSIPGGVSSGGAGGPARFVAPSCLLLLGFLLGACGEHVLATVGIISGAPDSGGSEGDGDGPRTGDGAAPVEPSLDAGARDAAPAEGADGSVVGDCLILRDQSVIMAPPASGDVVEGTTVEAAMCPEVEATGEGDSAIWSREDGAPLMEADARYSFRWPEEIRFLKALRLFGGPEPCSTEEVHDWTAMPGTFLSSPGCADIQANFDVTYLRMAHLYSQWDKDSDFMVPMQLCEAPCPPAM